MRYFPAAALTAAACVMCASLYAAEFSGRPISAGELNASCETGDGSKICSAYIAGFSQGFYYAAVSAKAGYAPCLPRRVTDDRARTIAIDYMNAHPEMRRQGAPSVIAEALIEAFPCTAPN